MNNIYFKIHYKHLNSSSHRGEKAEGTTVLPKPSSNRGNPIHFRNMFDNIKNAKKSCGSCRGTF